jgi:hypothetical protein
MAVHFPARVKVEENTLLYLFWGIHKRDYTSCTARLVVNSKTQSQSGRTCMEIVFNEGKLWLNNAIFTVFVVRLISHQENHKSTTFK